MSAEAVQTVLEQCQAVIFDLDGVIADTEPLKFAAYQAVFQEVYGIELPASDITWRGMKEQSVINYWFSKFQLVGDLEKLVQAKRIAYQDFLHKERVTAIPGVIDFVHRLKELSKVCGVATSSSRQEAKIVLECLDLSLAFDIVITRDDVQKLKPHPEVYLQAALALKSPPRNCVVFEDSQSGVNAAKAAGMFCIGLMTSFSEEALSMADAIIADFTELLDA
jgi:HAD superfamily hydrolase (TIGR01509 family)